MISYETLVILLSQLQVPTLWNPITPNNVQTWDPRHGSCLDHDHVHWKSSQNAWNTFVWYTSKTLHRFGHWNSPKHTIFPHWDLRGYYPLEVPPGTLSRAPLPLLQGPMLRHRGIVPIFTFAHVPNIVICIVPFTSCKPLGLWQVACVIGHSSNVFSDKRYSSKGSHGVKPTNVQLKKIISRWRNSLVVFLVYV